MRAAEAGPMREQLLDGDRSQSRIAGRAIARPEEHAERGVETNLALLEERGNAHARDRLRQARDQCPAVGRESAIAFREHETIAMPNGEPATRDVMLLHPAHEDLFDAVDRAGLLGQAGRGDEQEEGGADPERAGHFDGVLSLTSS